MTGILTWKDLREKKPLVVYKCKKCGKWDCGDKHLSRQKGIFAECFVPFCKPWPSGVNWNKEKGVYLLNDKEVLVPYDWIKYEGESSCVIVSDKFEVKMVT